MKERDHYPSYIYMKGYLISYIKHSSSSSLSIYSKKSCMFFFDHLLLFFFA